MDREKIVEAMGIIKKTCEMHVFCISCPFGVKRRGLEYECYITQKSPYRWKINEPKELGRAYKEE